MRLQKVIALGDGRAVLLHELRVRDARHIMAQAKSLEQVDVEALLGERFDEVALLLDDCIQMPMGETLDDLSSSELDLVKAGLMEINAAFLALLGLAGLAPPTLSGILTEPASPSLSADT